MATIRDVAARAGVSLGTASRALTGRGRTSETARRRVLMAAEELGYRVNKAARSLRTNRTDTIGLLVSDVRNPFFAELAYVVDKAASARGQSVITVSADESTAGQVRALRSLVQQGVDGLIVVPQNGELTDLPAQIPTVFVDRHINGLDIPIIESDHAAGMRLLVEHLVGLGHREIALISGPLATSTGRLRYEAALTGLADHGIEIPSQWLKCGDFQWQAGQRAAAQILASPQQPSAIIAADNTTAVGTLLAARDAGVRLGQDMALVAFDDAPWFSVVDPPLTVVAQDIEGLGIAAIDTLNQRLAGEEPAGQILPARLIVRKSCQGGLRPRKPKGGFHE